VPLVGLDRVLGVLFVRGTDVYTDDHLRLMSVVAAQIAAYITACRLREHEAQKAVDHAAARADADANSRARDEFLAILAREVRNVLEPMRESMRTLAAHGERDPAVRQATDVVERQAEHATGLLDDLLNVSRLDGGKGVLHKERLALQALVAAAVQTAKASVAAREHRLSVSVPEEPLWLVADAARLSHVIGSLLDNAVKFTSPGGVIGVSAARELSDVVLRVCDTGAGISAEMLPLVFDRCARARRSLPYGEEGLGLGLTLARILVELHGGTVSARSEGPGRGSEFVVRLPGA
jgi:signal transduction histidine kinase